MIALQRALTVIAPETYSQPKTSDHRKASVATRPRMATPERELVTARGEIHRSPRRVHWQLTSKPQIELAQGTSCGSVPLVPGGNMPWIVCPAWSVAPKYMFLLVLAGLF
jgi:hypothetical protein